MNRGLKSIGLFFIFVVVVVAGRNLGLVHHAVTTTSTTSTTTSSTSTSTLAPVACQGGDFSSVDNGGQGAAGTAYDSATLTKVTPGSCVVDGYPLLTLQTSQGVVVTSITTDHSASSAQFTSAAANAAPQAITVAKGTALRFDYTYSENGTNCATISTINVQVAKNGSSSPISLSFPASVCGPVTVSALYLDPGAP